jgi:hypothetical protein
MIFQIFSGNKKEKNKTTVTVAKQPSKPAGGVI